jgi:hypothetical protein
VKNNVMSLEIYVCTLSFSKQAILCLKSDPVLNDTAGINYFESFDTHLVERQEDIGRDPSLMSGHWYG